MTKDPRDDRVTMGERYGGATSSSNLRVKSESQGDAEVLIAAGWLDDSLGAMLFRLARELEVAKGEHGIAQVEFDRIEAAASRLEKEAAGEKDQEVRYFKTRDVENMREMAKAQAISSRLMTLTQLKSLREVKQALYGIAINRARALKLGWEDGVVASIVGQALDVHLDRACHHCQGRGRNGGYGAPMVLCRNCKGRGQRGPRDIGKDAEQRLFGKTLLDDMNRLLAHAAAGMVRTLRGSNLATAEEIRRAEADLADRLARLRSPEAQAD